EPKLWPYGEDIDFCWRAQIAGARVMVAPAARAAHRAASLGGHREGIDQADRKAVSRHRDEVRATELHHRVRMVVTNYTLPHLIRVVPQLLLVLLGELAYALVAGRRRVTAAVFGSWRDVFTDIKGIRESRKRINAARQFPDSEVRRLQARGFARLTRFVRGQLHGEDRARQFAESGTEFLREVAGSRSALIVWGALFLVLLTGTRDLLFGNLPAIGQFSPAPGVGSLFRQFFSGWRTSGLGAESPAPPAFAFLGVSGAVLLGSIGLAQKVLVLALVPIGFAGAYRLARSLDVPRAGIVALATYAAVPLPYAAISRGRWDGLIAYAVAPWILGRMRTSVEGAGTRVAEPADGRQRAPFLFDWRSGLSLALILGVAAAFAPGLLAMTLVLAVGVFTGSLLVGETKGGFRAIVLGLVAVGVALLLLAPWSFTMLHPEGLVHALFGPGLSASRGLSFGEALRLETGRLGGAPLGWLLLVAAVLPLAIGRGWRLSWAIRCWAIIITNAIFVTAIGRGWLGLPVPSPEMYLAPSAIALAWAITLGFIAFRIDLRELNFGWPQAAAVVASAAFGLASLPVVAAAASGDWWLRSSTLASQLGYIEADPDKGDFRVLWLGDPETLPVDSWRIAPGLAFGTSRNGLGTLADQWVPNRPGASNALGDAVKIALNGRTTTLGHLLGPMGVRYVVIPRRVGPRGAGRPLLPPSRDVAGALAEQTDFRQLDATNDVAVFENAAWVPVRAALSAGQAQEVANSGRGFEAVSGNQIGGAKRALAKQESEYEFSGTLNDPALYFAETPSSRWTLQVDGDKAVRGNGFGFGSVYTVADGGKANLQYKTPIIRGLTLVLELAVWAAVVRTALNFRRSRRGELV
ncbi:MAG: hypothetical protein Q8K63_15920, partial [Acidimicrobiales bacterium]|nr:hypothetical protein [Acidimicrobiales bacterium]